MSSRTPLILGLAGLGVIVGGIVWFTQVDSTGAIASPTVPSAPPKTAPAVVLDHELAPTEKLQAPTSRADGKPAVTVQAQPATDRKSVSQTPAAPPAIAQTGAIENVVTVTEPKKLQSLDPILGGAAAIKGRYSGSTYAERMERAELIQGALDGGGATEQGQTDLYQALKDELIWLRENMGTPPSEKPK